MTAASTFSTYCHRKNGQILELTESFQLNLISESGLLEEHKVVGISATISPSKYLYTMKGPQKDDEVVMMKCNELGNLLAILVANGEYGEERLLVLKLPELASTTVEEIELDLMQRPRSGALTPGIVGMAWHPASPADHHLVLLRKNGHLSMYNCRQSPRDFEHESEEIGHEASKTTSFTADTTAIAAEQELRLPCSRMDPYVALTFFHDAFYKFNENLELLDPWLPFSLLIGRESGDLFLLCPFLPMEFRCPRRFLDAIEGQDVVGVTDADVDRQCHSKVSRRWLQEVKSSMHFISSAAPGISWVSAKLPRSFADCRLQAAPQGPFLIQPEPVEVGKLTAMDRLQDLRTRLHGGEPGKGLFMVAAAFGSGRLDIMAICTDIQPDFQLESTADATNPDLGDLPIMALLESVDVFGTGGLGFGGGARRSVENQLKLLAWSRRGLYLSTEKSLISVRLDLKDEGGFDLDNKTSDELGTLKISCKATILANPDAMIQCLTPQMISFPGAVRILDEAPQHDEAFDSFSGTTSTLLETINKHAFPLGKVELERGSIQLQGLLDDLLKTLQRFKKSKSQGATSSGDSQADNSRLPEGISETSSSWLNDQISTWQEGVIIPALRVGHEIALRSEELVVILTREREVLLRARDLLAAKPGRLQAILNQLHAACQVNEALNGRLNRLVKEMNDYTPIDKVFTAKLLQISQNLDQRASSSFLGSRDTREIVLEAQLALQEELLANLREKLAKLT